MHQKHQDAMRIICKFGKPDFFVTVTCNPKWRETRENLKSYQRAENCSDLVARIFDLKLKELFHYICKEHILGKVLANIHFIVF